MRNKNRGKNKNEKNLMIIFLSLSLLTLSGCSDTKVNSSSIEVRGLTLKLSLIRVASDVYSINYGSPDLFTEELYKNQGEYGVYYYEWVKDTYASMDSEMKERLIRIFESPKAYPSPTITISLDDDADIKKIIETLLRDDYIKSDEMQKEDIDIFFNYFYEEHLKDFIKENNTEIEKSKDELNSFLSKENIDIFKFMEDESGVKFRKDYKAVFYFDLPPIGAIGFKENNIKISTLQQAADKNTLLNTPFHEYSHELFRTFTRKTDFMKLANKLRSNESLNKGFENGVQEQYDWIGWCEENLVEGFASYLTYKYYGDMSSGSTYAYDLMFCEYLLENNFNPEEKKLKDISIEFYEKVLDDNL